MRTPDLHRQPLAVPLDDVARGAVGGTIAINNAFTGKPAPWGNGKAPTWSYFNLRCHLTNGQSVRSYKVTETGSLPTPLPADAKTIYPHSMCRDSAYNGGSFVRFPDASSATGAPSNYSHLESIDFGATGSSLNLDCPILTFLPNSTLGRIDIDVQVARSVNNVTSLTCTVSAVDVATGMLVNSTSFNLVGGPGPFSSVTRSLAVIGTPGGRNLFNMNCTTDVQGDARIFSYRVRER